MPFAVQMIAGEKQNVGEYAASTLLQGSPSSLLERDNPDWVPSLCLGYVRSGTGVECIVGRYRRSQERKERVLESA